jgi:mRNA interferase RelE/StbE
VAYRVELLPSAARQYRRLPRTVKSSVRAAIDRLADDPRPPGARKLVDSAGYWRVRVADYRILYEIRDLDVLVLVVIVGHRRDVYR